MKKLVFLFLFIFSTLISASEVDYDDLRKIHSPEIKGDTLYIKGKIDSHIYDFISYEYRAMKEVKYVSLNSFGGSAEWGIEVGRRIQELGKSTKLEKGNVCASACTYIFGSGKERIMSKETWLGVHGARLGGSYVSSFQGFCFVDMADGSSIFVEGKEGCREHLDNWYKVAFDMTSRSFDLLERAGVDPAFRDYYFSLEDDHKWYEYMNVLRKPDLIVDPELALKYRFATELN